jgi:hypothetical protein
MTNGLSIGRRYRFTISGRYCSGTLEGVLRSLTVPAGTLGNGDGEHRVWIAGEQFEWFLRSSEIAGFEELREPFEVTPPAVSKRPRRAEDRPPYRGSCLPSGRPSKSFAVSERHPLLTHLVGRHRREQ